MENQIAHSRIVSTFSLCFEWDIRTGNALISGRDIDETMKDACERPGIEMKYGRGSSYRVLSQNQLFPLGIE